MSVPKGPTSMHWRVVHRGDRSFVQKFRAKKDIGVRGAAPKPRAVRAAGAPGAAPNSAGAEIAKLTAMREKRVKALRDRLYKAHATVAKHKDFFEKRRLKALDRAEQAHAKETARAKAISKTKPRDEKHAARLEAQAEKLRARADAKRLTAINRANASAAKYSGREEQRGKKLTEQHDRAVAALHARLDKQRDALEKRAGATKPGTPAPAPAPTPKPAPAPKPAAPKPAPPAPAPRPAPPEPRPAPPAPKPAPAPAPAPPRPAPTPQPTPAPTGAEAARPPRGIQLGRAALMHTKVSGDTPDDVRAATSAASVVREAINAEHRMPLGTFFTITSRSVDSEAPGQIGGGHYISLNGRARGGRDVSTIPIVEGVARHLDTRVFSKNTRPINPTTKLEDVSAMHTAHTPALRQLRDALMNSNAVKSIEGDTPEETARLRDPHHVFARAYTQYLAHRSNPVRGGMTFSNTRRKNSYWDYNDFLPIHQAIDAVLREQGLRD